tara:strand:- start:20 stop:244 length:225 start_codon:yes stop_codon:yes gene_type:complete
MIDKLKSGLGDWWKSASSKRLQAAVITAIFTTVATNSGFITEQQALYISGLIIAVVIGDSYRPLNPEKANGNGS